MKKITLSKIFRNFYSYFIKRRFFSCGNRFRIEFPSIINSPEKISIGNNVYLMSHCWINCIKNSKKEASLIIGNGCSIGRFSHINAYESVIIEDNVLISDRVHISDVTHLYEDSSIPIIKQGVGYLGPVVIKKGVWIGIGAVILPNVTIGENAVVGANSIVTKNIPRNCIAKGIPAKISEKNMKSTYFKKYKR